MNNRVFNCGQDTSHTSVHPYDDSPGRHQVQLWSDLVMRRQLHTHEEFGKLMKGLASVYLGAQSLDGDILFCTPLSKRDHLHLSSTTSMIGW